MPRSITVLSRPPERRYGYSDDGTRKRDDKRARGYIRLRAATTSLHQPMIQGSILGLVFSKDRALQLEACITSFARHVEDAASVNLVVVYGASSDRFLRQYEALARRYDGTARFLPEGRFRPRVLELLRSAGRSPSPARRPVLLDRLRRSVREPAPAPDEAADFVLFLVDDTLFVRRLRLELAMAALQANPDALGFSLRLGRNIIRSYVLERQQELPRFWKVGEGILKYDWTQADGDFGYPLEVSSSLYRFTDVLRLVTGLSFRDPNTLESQMALRAPHFSRSQPSMLCSYTSVAFSAPVNRVQVVYENRAGANPVWSTESLADKFDHGLRIDVAALDGYVPSACHEEVELPFERSRAQNSVE
ncbi:MAG: hypothetical protein V1755_04865 [Chloroflexota bacterium]